MPLVYIVRIETNYIVSVLFKVFQRNPKYSWAGRNVCFRLQVTKTDIHIEKSTVHPPSNDAWSCCVCLSFPDSSRAGSESEIRSQKMSLIQDPVWSLSSLQLATLFVLLFVSYLMANMQFRTLWTVSTKMFTCIHKKIKNVDCFNYSYTKLK